MKHTQRPAHLFVVARLPAPLLPTLPPLSLFFFQQYSTNGFYYVPSSYPEVKDQIYDFVISPSIYGYDQVQAAYLGRDNPQYKIKLYNDKGEVVRMYWAAPHASCYQNTDVKPGAVKKVTYSKRCYHHCKGLESP